MLAVTRSTNMTNKPTLNMIELMIKIERVVMLTLDLIIEKIVTYNRS